MIENIPANLPSHRSPFRAGIPEMVPDIYSGERKLLAESEKLLYDLDMENNRFIIVKQSISSMEKL